MKIIAPLFCLILGMAALAFAGEKGPIVPSPKDKCPVCGMFVKKYPDWTSQIIFKDGSYAVFDGAKDMFKYFLRFQEFNPTHAPTDIDSLYVMEYYSMHPIDGREAYYVVGSDVFGPMGRELIPFAMDEEAREFMKDHKGRAVLKFNEVTADTLKGLD